MRRLELVPYAHMSDNELMGIAHWLYTTVSGEGGARDLAYRNLHGAVKRHSISPNFSFRALDRVRSDMEWGLLSAFAIKNQAGQPIGQATIMPNVELRRQRTWLPRLLPLIAGQTVDTAELGASASAWLHTGDVAADRRRLTEAYGALREKADGPLWTIEPMTAAHDVLNPSPVKAIEDAGFIAMGDPAYYDDQESKLRTLPKSYLLAAPAAA